MHDHRSNIFRLDLGAGRDLHAELGEHVLQTVEGIGRIGVLVTRTVQPHHQTVADELIATHSLDRGKVLDAFSRYWR